MQRRITGIMEEPMEKHLMAIPNRCTGCNRCVYACSAVKEGMFMPSKARIHVSNMAHEGYSVPSVCFQCPKASCMEACPTGARVFSNLLDPDSEISYILRNKRVYILKEEAGTIPRFYYYFEK